MTSSVHVERVAEAIWRATVPAAVEKGITFDEQADHGREVFRRLAQAAIDAMELTPSQTALAPSDFPQAVYPETVGPAHRTVDEMRAAWPFPAMSPSDAVPVSRLVSPWVQAGTQ